MPSPHRVPLWTLLAANALSYTAEAIATVAIPWFVLELTGSYAQMGIVGFFTFLPRVVATFFGGQVVDRLGYRYASIVSDLLSGASVSAIPLFYALDRLNFGWLIVFVVLGAFFDGPGATAREVMVPELAQRAEIPLTRVNAFFQGARRLSLFVGPMTAGFLVAWMGVHNVLWVNAALFTASALITISLIPNVGLETHEEERGSFRSNILFGFRFLRQQPLLIWLATMVCLMNFLDAPLTTVQLPALVREHYGGAEQLGILIGLFGAGAVLGAFTYSLLAPRLGRRITFLWSFSLVGIGFGVLAMAPPYPVTVALMALIGIVGSPLNPILMTVRQERVPLAYRARVFGTTTAIAFVAIPFGQLIGGYVVEWLGVRVSVGIMAGAYLAMVAVFALNPTLREMDQPPASAERIAA